VSGPADRRVDAIDAVRGVALFGVLVVNLLTAFRVSLFQHYFGKMPDTGPLDRAVDGFMALAIESKAFTLFSFLFGLGLGIQRGSAARAGRAFVPQALRRLVFLLVVGAAHLFLVWNGDILTEYAVLGLVALPLVAWASDRTLLGLGAALLVFYAIPLRFSLPWFATGELERHIAGAAEAYGRGGFAEVLAFRVHEVKFIATLLVRAAPRTLGLILLGAYIGRSKTLVRTLPRRRALLGNLAVWGLLVGAFATVLGKMPASRARLGFYAEAADLVAVLALALLYAALVARALRGGWGRAVRHLSPLGRMAFTNYLTQSVVLGFVFYGYGLGLFNQLGSAAALLMAVALYALQAVFSALWLRRFRYGPLEWLWRSATYRSWMPLRRA
jgi:uncharacterized protein